MIHKKERIDISKTLNGANGFIFGSRIEYNPLVVFESMAAGVPFVSFDVGIIKEIINKYHLGFVSNDKFKLSKYLNNLNSSNYNKYQIIKNFEKKNFNWKIILKNIIEFLKNMNENKIKNTLIKIPIIGKDFILKVTILSRLFWLREKIL